MSGEQRVQAVIAALDDLAAWTPEDMPDVFRTLRELPDLIGAAGETVTVVAASAGEARVVRSEVISATEEAGAWVTAAAGGLGTAYAPWTMLRGGSSRWLPPGRGAA